MLKAAGAVFVSLDTKRVFLQLRSHTVKHPMTWGFVGGKIDDGETILKGLTREIKEEIGFVPKYEKVLTIDVFLSQSHDFMFHSFVITVPNEFIPILNNESSGYGWFNIDGLPKPLLSGAKSTLLNRSFKRFFREI